MAGTEKCVVCGDDTGLTRENRLVSNDGYGPLCRDCKAGMDDDQGAEGGVWDD